MRILAFSDLHRNIDVAREILHASRAADVVVGAGDFATKGYGLEDTMEVLRGLVVPAVFVAGNHDSLQDLRVTLRERDNIHVLHGQGIEIGGMPFFGLGFEIPAGLNEPWNQRLEEAEAVPLLERCPQGAVLVTHSPPLGVADLERIGSHEGSRAIHDAVKALNPRLHLCGHIHHAWGSGGVIGNCPIHNLGPTINWFTLK